MSDDLRAREEIYAELAANILTEKLFAYSSAMQAVGRFDLFVTIQGAIAALSEAANIERLSLVAGSLADMIAKGSDDRF